MKADIKTLAIAVVAGLIVLAIANYYVGKRLEKIKGEIPFLEAFL